uniref:Uncharacterized protein n=1 Tax=Anguilla anguilla TaxID=7936 RepID=A0A0E9TCC5_ANGAN
MYVLVKSGALFQAVYLSAKRTWNNKRHTLLYENREKASVLWVT